MIAWSYTRLKDFERCPLIFKLKYVTKEILFTENAATKEGTRKHKILENATKALVRTPDLKLVESDVSHVYPILNGFIKSNDSINAELELAFNSRLEKCSWFAQEAWLRIKIDLVGVKKGALTDTAFETQRDVAAIIDWKTGKVRVDEDQLRLYNLGILLSDPNIGEAQSSLVFIDQKQVSKVLATRRTQMAVEIEEFADRAEAIQIASEKDHWPPQQNQFCGRCEANVLQCEFKR